jgi:DNA polymerase-3 subunit alpha
MPAPFVHLRVHSHYSLLSSSIRHAEAFARAKAFGQPALAITDDGNLFGSVESDIAAEAAGMRAIVGCDLYVARGSRREKPDPQRDPPWRLVVLCEDQAGYRSLTHLASLGFLEGLHDGRPHVDQELLAAWHEGLIALSPGTEGEIGSLLASGRDADALAAAARLRDVFGSSSAFVGLQDHGEDGAAALNRRLADVAARAGIGVVALNDCRFLEEGHLEAYRALHAIGAGLTLDDPSSRVGTPLHHVRSAADMVEAFAMFPEAIANTVAIAERCRYSIPRAVDPMLPDFAVPAGETLESYVRRMAREGLDARRAEWTRLPAGSRPAIPDKDYDARLEMELDVITRMGFPGYFLIVWDLFRHARAEGIPVGPGRGSSAGSLVAYSLRITDLDPLQHGLLFERFLNPGRKSLPDIDMDFCQRRRGELLDYVKRKYGEDHVAQIITFGALNARSVVRDVGRVLNMSYGEVDRIARMIPDGLGVTLGDALREAPALVGVRDADPRVARLLEIAAALEGLARNAGVHAAGVIIAPRPLIELAPLFKTGRNEVTTQYAMGGAEAVGLVKMDFLGLKTLTVLDDAVKSIERREGVHLDFGTLPLDDARTFDLFRQAKSSGIFQFESGGMRDYLRKLSPESLEDLIALNALYRPGPLESGVVDQFIARRRGREKVTYPHPLLEQALSSTYGVMVYQEQVMQASRQLAGFSQSEADDLRKAMGKKKPEVMAKQKSKFVDGATQKGVKHDVAAAIFDAMEKFAGYAFNRSHSAAYALVAYWCAYLKANYPVHFMAALLTSEGDNTEKVVRYTSECREMGVAVLAPDVNESLEDFAVVDPRTIRFGLSAIKGVGHSAVQSILEARQRVGRFRSLHQFCEEIDLRLNNKKVLEALVKAGALDSLGAGRSTLVFALDAAVDAATKARADRESGQKSLFGSDDAEVQVAEPVLATMPDWPRSQRLQHEKEVLGFYVSGHPLEEHADLLRSMAAVPLHDLLEMDGKEASVAGMVASFRKLRTKRGDWMAFVQVEDLGGTAEIVVFPETWKSAQALVQEGALLTLKGKVEVDGDRAKIIAQEIGPLSRAQRAAASGLLVKLPPRLPRQELDALLERADAVLARMPGRCPVRFELTVPEVGVVTVEAGARFSVDPDPGLVGQLEEIVGAGRVGLTFA